MANSSLLRKLTTQYRILAIEPDVESKSAVPPKQQLRGHTFLNFASKPKVDSKCTWPLSESLYG